jgi:hypothetical protein
MKKLFFVLFAFIFYNTSFAQNLLHITVDSIYTLSAPVGGINAASADFLEDNRDSTLFQYGSCMGNSDADMTNDTSVFYHASNLIYNYFAITDNYGKVLRKKKLVRTLTGASTVNMKCKRNTQKNIWLYGTYSGNIDINPSNEVKQLTTPFHAYNAVILKLDSLGNYLWHNKFSNNGGGIDIVDIDFLSDGSVIATILSDSLLKINDTTTIAGVSYSFNFIIIKFDNSGNLIWHRQLNSNPNYYKGINISVKPDNNILLRSSFYNTVDMDWNSGVDTVGVPLKWIWSVDTYPKLGSFIAEYDQDGNYIFGYPLKSTSSAYIQGISVDSSSIYVALSYCDTLNINLVGGLNNIYAPAHNSIVPKFNLALIEYDHYFGLKKHRIFTDTTGVFLPALGSLDKFLLPTNQGYSYLITTLKTENFFIPNLFNEERYGTVYKIDSNFNTIGRLDMQYILGNNSACLIDNKNLLLYTNSNTTHTNYNSLGSPMFFPVGGRILATYTQFNVNAENIFIQNIKVYPNPATDYFVVELGNPNTPHSLVLRNILGEMILQIPMQLHPENLRINTQNLPTGIYTYTLTNAKGQQATGKIAKF